MDFKTLFINAIVEATQLDKSVVDRLIEVPPDPAFGDFAFPCFVLAKELKKAPPQIAAELAEKITSEHFEKVEAKGPYINVFVNKQAYLRGIFEKELTYENKNIRVHVEHLSANPNKPLHLGHARNSCIGDSLYRLHDHMGFTVDAGHYGDDSGVNVGKNIMGHLYYEYPVDTEKKYDHYCGDIYAEMAKHVDEEEYKAKLSETLLAIEKRSDEKITELHEEIVDRCTIAQLETCTKLGMEFDMVTWETDILHLHLFEDTMERLKKTKYVFQIEEGKGEGCWVIDLREVPEFSHLEFPYQVLVKGDGVATYAGKDIVYAMWKLGYLEKDFHYKRYLDYDSGKVMYSTSSKPEDQEKVPFGDYDKAIAVIDDRQSHEQNVVKTALKILGYENDTKHYYHLAYGVVYLTPKTLMDFGFTLSDEEKAEKRLPFASRKGWSVSIDDTLELLQKKAYEETKQRNPEESEEWLQNVAEKIAVSSFRFMLTKFDANIPLTFDIDEALDMQGATGAYVLYTYARMSSVFAQGGVDPDSLSGSVDVTKLSEDIEFQVAKKIMELEDVLEQAERQLAPNVICRYSIELCQMFNSYYAKCSFLKSEDDVKVARLALLKKLRATLKTAMNLVGMQELERM